MPLMDQWRSFLKRLLWIFFFDFILFFIDILATKIPRSVTRCYDSNLQWSPFLAPTSYYYRDDSVLTSSYFCVPQHVLIFYTDMTQNKSPFQLQVNINPGILITHNSQLYHCICSVNLCKCFWRFWWKGLYITLIYLISAQISGQGRSIYFTMETNSKRCQDLILD